MGLFHHRASLAWEWEETRFRGWCPTAGHHVCVGGRWVRVLCQGRGADPGTSHTAGRSHYTTPTRLHERLIDVAQAPHTQLHGYHHASEAPEPSDWRDTRARWEPPWGCSTTGPHSHGSGRRPGFVAGARLQGTMCVSEGVGCGFSAKAEGPTQGPHTRPGGHTTPRQRGSTAD